MRQLGIVALVRRLGIVREISSQAFFIKGRVDHGGKKTAVTQTRRQRHALQKYATVIF